MSGVLKTKAWMKWIVILVSLPITQNVAAQTVLAPTRQITYEEALQTGNPLPRWEHGYLVSWKMDSSSDTAENISLYDRDGAAVGKTRIWLEGASFLRIEDAAARKDGRVAVVGWALTSSGTLAAFLADVSITQHSAQIIQTSPSRAAQSLSAPTGRCGCWVRWWDQGAARSPRPTITWCSISAPTMFSRISICFSPASAANCPNKSTGYLAWQLPTTALDFFSFLPHVGRTKPHGGVAEPVEMGSSVTDPTRQRDRGRN